MFQKPGFGEAVRISVPPLWVITGFGSLHAARLSRSIFYFSNLVYDRSKNRCLIVLFVFDKMNLPIEGANDHGSLLIGQPGYVIGLFRSHHIS
jgi:hypothetical protein